MFDFYFKVYTPTKIKEWDLYENETYDQLVDYRICCYTASNLTSAVNKVQKYHPDCKFDVLTEEQANCYW